MRLDGLGFTLVVLAVMIDLYLVTFTQSVEMLYPTVLLLAGVMLLRLYTDFEVEGRARLNYLYYTAMALVGIGIVGLAIPRIFRPQSIATLELTGFQVTLLVILMAVAEEVFFRGFLLSFFSRKLSSTAIAVLFQAIVWAVYHTAVYGSMPGTLVYVVFSGLILGYVTVRSGTLTPAMLAHIIINYIATGGGGIW